MEAVFDLHLVRYIMPADAPRSPEAIASSEAHEALVELLVGYVDRAYVTAGQPGTLTTVRELFRRLDRQTLTGLTYELGLETEPVAEDEPGRRP